jgi:catechol 2,3-dioxygenase-like lactoylglutathione lyase family enzyme
MNLTSPVKRVTIWVRDLERSLAVYHGILGLTVVEEKVLEGPAIAAMVNLRTCRLRIAHLAAEGSDHGLVGLYEVSAADPPLPALPRQPRDRLSYGQATIVLYTGRLGEIVPRLEAEGLDMLRTPVSYVRERSADMFAAGRYTELIFFDPDGVPVSLLGYEPLPG